MLKLPFQYSDLYSRYCPRLVREFVPLYGTTEYSGPADNPTILAWAKEIGIAYSDDSIPWCGLGMAVVAKRAQWTYMPGNNPLWAENWLSWENKAPTPMLGDVLVFSRPGGNHVGVYIGEDAVCYHVLAANQGDAVSIRRLSKSRLRGARRPRWKVQQPASVKKVYRSAYGSISINES